MIEEAKKFIETIEDVETHSKFILHLFTVWKMSIKDICQCYNNCSQEDIANHLINFYNITLKKCTICGQFKNLSGFTTNGKSINGIQRYRSNCKVCQNEISKDFYIDHIDEIKEQRKNHYLNNIDTILEKSRDYQSRPEVKERRHNYEKTYLKEYHSRPEVKLHCSEWGKNYRSDPNVKQRRREYDKNRYYSDLKIRLTSVMRSSIYRSLRGNKQGQHWESLVGYNIDDLINHLEKKFKDGMTWENIGTYWHIDHIIPVCKFNILSYNDKSFKKCWSLQNLQPLLAEDNLKKNDTISEEWNNIELAARLLEN